MKIFGISVLDEATAVDIVIIVILLIYGLAVLICWCQPKVLAGHVFPPSERAERLYPLRPNQIIFAPFDPYPNAPAPGDRKILGTIRLPSYCSDRRSGTSSNSNGPNNQMDTSIHSNGPNNMSTSLMGQTSSRNLPMLMLNVCTSDSGEQVVRLQPLEASGLFLSTQNSDRTSAGSAIPPSYHSMESSQHNLANQIVWVPCVPEIASNNISG